MVGLSALGVRELEVHKQVCRHRHGVEAVETQSEDPGSGQGSELFRREQGLGFSGSVGS